MQGVWLFLMDGWMDWLIDKIRFMVYIDTVDTLNIVDVWMDICIDR